MRIHSFRISRSALLAAGTLGLAQAQLRPSPPGDNTLIPPSTPLVACDPYFSIWSPADTLTATETTHWTGRRHQVTSVVKVDGQAFRVMGATPVATPPMAQTGLTVLPTTTTYSFEGGGIALDLNFITPALPEDIDLLSRPVTYLAYDFKATDGKEHEVAVYFGASGELTVNNTDQEIEWNDASGGGLAAVRMGSVEQPILMKKGDDHRIDWGYLYLAAPEENTAARAFARPNELAVAFAGKGLADQQGASGTAKHADSIGAGLELKPLKVGAETVSTWAMIAYDDLFGIQFNRKNLRPFWRRDGWEAKDLLEDSAKQFPTLRQRCEAFDAEVMADMAKLGGEKYAKLAALCYRQALAAGKFVADDNGQPLQFSKENHSNGCIATSDVFYPMAPQFLLFSPSLAKSFIAPFMEYAKSERWKFPFAPHDLGTYPQANGQVYGGGEKTEENQMPVEESGNMLILMAAVAQMEGNADFAGRYWDRLVQWANYLKEEGFDPDNQLCTDDFSGHLAHNVNLSAKAICGLGAFAKLCELRGDQEMAAEYGKIAKDYAQRWVEEGKDGDHYKLAFDRPGTWSQKYNLVWDKILGLELFPDEVRRTEMDFYKAKQNRYGLPLDNRATYTKLDWVVWTATLTGDKADFQALVDPVFKFVNEGPARAPLTDWYDTITGRKQNFTARPVVGGVFIPALYDKEMWAKYAARDVSKSKGWAPMPEYIAPILTSIVPNAMEKGDVIWQYTTDRPEGDWFAADYDASRWKSGAAGFGGGGPPNTKIRTPWTSADIWLRREVTLPASIPDSAALSAHFDEDVEIYINGVRAGSAGGFVTDHTLIPLSDAGKAALKPGKNLIAVHCHQTSGGQYIDVGIVDVQPGK
uniref:glutaminase family protein n=1 Tax=Luteolibacter marinus TaxID=2776705 RepID=UPI00186758CC